MLHSLLEHYIDPAKLPRFMPIEVAAVDPWDYHLYLYRTSTGWLVVAEADFLFLTDIPKDIEDVFGVEVQGWCTLLEYQAKTGILLLPPSSFADATKEEEYYRGIVVKNRGMRYALLQVLPSSE